MGSTDDAGHLQIDQVDGLIAAAGIDGTHAILDAFWRSTAELLEALSAQIKDQDFSLAAMTAHAVKGSAANIGAVRLAQSAAEMEIACKNGKSSDIGDMLDALNQDFQSVRECFKEHLAKAGV